MEGLIQKLGLRKPTIVGHSQGALVAMEVYRRCGICILEIRCGAACCSTCRDV